jgi:hypothetical protein
MIEIEAVELESYVRYLSLSRRPFAKSSPGPVHYRPAPARFHSVGVMLQQNG